MEKDIKKVCFLALGCSGFAVSAAIALKCPEIRVTLVITNPNDIYQLNSKQIHPYVQIPGLQEMIQSRHGKNLFFTTNAQNAINEADVIFVLSESNLKTQGEGEKQAVDLAVVDQAACLIAEHSKFNKIVVESSSVPLLTAECVQTVLKCNSKPGVEFKVLSNPEFYEEGSNIKNLMFPDIIMIGCDETPKSAMAAKALSKMYSKWVPSRKIITSKTWTVELSKICSCAMLAQNLASIYAMTAICEEYNADILKVMRALVVDGCSDCGTPEPNISFGKFPLWILNLIYICECNSLLEVANYWRQVLVLYELHKQRLLNRLICIINQTNCKKKVSVLGFAYYMNTDITTGSMAVEFCKLLAEQHATIKIYDPKIGKEKVVKELQHGGCKVSTEKLNELVSVHDDPLSAVTQTQVMILCGFKSDFAHLNYSAIYERMEKPAFVIDSGYIIPRTQLLGRGFKVNVIGNLRRNNY